LFDFLLESLELIFECLFLLFFFGEIDLATQLIRKDGFPLNL